MRRLSVDRPSDRERSSAGVEILTVPAGRELGGATRATYAAFFATGFAFASWASRIPQVKDRLGLDPSALGLVLLSIAAGSVIALPLSGPVVGRFGSRRTVAAMAVLAGVGLVIVAVGYQLGVAPVVAGLCAFGVATGGWDVAMNVQGAIVERRLGRAIMSRFHAGFSLGAVAGALGGAAMVALGVSVTAHLLIVALAVATAVPLIVQRFVSDHADSKPSAAASIPGAARDSLRAWGERRTVLIGVFVLAFAFAEGSGNDWISVAIIGAHGADPAVGTLAFAVFLAAMTTGRWFGPRLLDAYGRVPVLRVLIVVAIAGLVLFAFGPSTPVAFAGVLLWGAGVSLGFPVGMSAGADDPALAAPRVSVIASIGYCAFLGGPPLIGFLGQRYTVPHALTAVIVLLALAGVLAGAVRLHRGAGV
jgi:predicted MFS family arabinose efflux permease